MIVSEQQRTGGRTIRGWHVLAALLAFFGVIFSVNGVFLYAALATHTGLVAKEPYVRGLKYNERIADDERQTSLGWHIDIAATNAAQPLRVALRGRDGNPLSHIELTATVGRPTTEGFDKALQFAATTDGVYEASLGELAAGSWVLSLEAKRRTQLGSVDTFRVRRRLWLKP